MESDINLPNVKIENIGAPKNFLLGRIYRVFFFLDLRAIKWSSKLKSFDLIIAHKYPLTYLAHITKKRYGVRYCFFNHGEPPSDILLKYLSRNFIEKIYHFVGRKVEDWMIKNADFAISNSKFSRQMLRDRAGIDSVVIYNKIDLERFKGDLDRTIVRRKYGIEHSEALILFVGRVVPSKGIHLLIKAFKLLKQSFPDARLMIVGNPYYKDYFKKLKEISDATVVFASYVSDEELPYYYAACDVYATASLWEGFNLPLVEAQACGKPVVAFNIGPHPEVVNDGETGFLVPPKDVNALAEAIIKLIKDDKLRKEMGKNGYKMVREKLSIEGCRSLAES